jgi:uncharacterized protein with PQ loop repeat
MGREDESCYKLEDGFSVTSWMMRGVLLDVFQIPTALEQRRVPVKKWNWFPHSSFALGMEPIMF